MTNPKFTGVWIPREVFQHQSLSPTAKFVYGIVDSLDNDDGCYASNGYLSVSLGLAERQVRNLLKELEDAKLIVRIEREGKRIIRTVEKVALTQVLGVSGGGNKLPMGRQKIATGGGNKLPTYIKDYNKEDKDTPQTPKVAMEDLPQGGLALPFSSEQFSKAWFRWVDYRKEIKKTLKQSSVDLQWKQFILWGENKSIDSINQSITNGWTGLFEPKTQTNHKQPLTANDHNAF
ncbi:Helix-turn-helix domain containing protein [uncultured Caudovirales phage]|uniref:Helix-turn-helix domain containing protein n=1 Tax=uncultured Caudovirales phage TaxID=2100421 RepID=A0A6J7WAA2_9CAUD|nr:Helix-turn-helix domain containing protein [uncultured Caudovirales phage]